MTTAVPWQAAVLAAMTAVLSAGCATGRVASTARGATSATGSVTGGAGVRVVEEPLTLPLDDLPHKVDATAEEREAAAAGKLTRAEHSVVLENEYVRVRILPRHGGVIESAQFKPTEEEFFTRERRFRYCWPYWESGVKLSFPYHEHAGIHIDQPASHRIYRHPDGTVTCAMWMEFSRWNEKAPAYHEKTDKRGRKRRYFTPAAHSGGPRLLYSTMLVSQLVSLKPGEAKFDITYRLVNPTPFRQGRKIWNDVFFPRMHTEKGVIHGKQYPFPGRQSTEIVLPAAYVSDHGARKFRYWPGSETGIDRIASPHNSIFAWYAPFGFCGLWYPEVKVNRLRLTDTLNAPGTKLYFRGYSDKFDPKSPQSNIYNSMELWGGSCNLFEGTEEWIGPGEVYEFTHTFMLTDGIGKIDYADETVAVSVGAGGEDPAIEAVTMRPVLALSAMLDGRPLGDAVRCAPDRPARFRLPEGFDRGRLRLTADGAELVDHVFPLATDANTNLYPKVRAALDGASSDEMHGNGTSYRGALKRYPAGSVQRGRLLLRDGRLEEATQCLQAAVTNTPGDGEGWHLLGAALLQADSAGDAEAAFREALATDVSYPTAHYYLAVIALRDRRYDVARDELGSLAVSVPSHWEGRLLQAWTTGRLRTQRPEAVALAQRLVDEDPADPRALHVLLHCRRPAAGEAAAMKQLLREPGAKRRMDEFLAATRGRYLPAVPVGGVPGEAK